MDPLFSAFKSSALSATQEVSFYRRVLLDARTPVFSRLCLACALGYLALPLDIVPDFLPIIGHLNDIMIAGGLMWLAAQFIPAEVIADARREQASKEVVVIP